MAYVRLASGSISEITVSTINVHRSSVSGFTPSDTSVVGSYSSSQNEYIDEVPETPSVQTFYYVLEMVRASAPNIFTEELEVVISALTIDKPAITTANFYDSTNTVIATSSVFSASVSSEIHVSSEWEVRSAGRTVGSASSTSGDLTQENILIEDSVSGDVYYASSLAVDGVNPDNFDFDSAQNLYLSRPSSSIITKVNPAKTVEWSYDAVENIRGWHIASDDSLYVTSTNASLHNLVEKIDATGTAEWTYNNGSSIVSCVGTDSTNNVIFGGEGVTKISPTGTFVWNEPSYSDVRDLVVDSVGDIIIAETGRLVKLSSTGSFLWEWVPAGTIYSIGVDGADNIYYGNNSPTNRIQQILPDGTGSWDVELNNNALQIETWTDFLVATTSSRVYKIGLDGVIDWFTEPGDFSSSTMADIAIYNGDIYALPNDETIYSLTAPPDTSDLSVRVKYIGPTVESDWSDFYVI